MSGIFFIIKTVFYKFSCRFQIFKMRELVKIRRKYSYVYLKLMGRMIRVYSTNQSFLIVVKKIGAKEISTV